MAEQVERRSERFLKLYRILEGLLEKRYADGRVASGSVVMEYLRDPDSMPCRTDLDLWREIRNLLTHNAGDGGEAVVEPSEEMLRSLETIIRHVQRPRMAIDYGTPQEKILFAHPNDSALNLMRHMQKLGYSSVPVREHGRLVGVFSPGSLFAFIGERGFDRLNDDLLIGSLKSALEFGDERSEKYEFMPPNATLAAVRNAFEKRRARNSRLAAVFITQDGTRETPIVAMLTPWDVLKDLQSD